MFFEYGDDSVAQLGGVHLACEQASNLLTKVLEWGRLMSYLEQSTRYIAYDTRIGGRYRFYRDPEVLGSPLGTRYVGDMDRLFDTYAELVPLLAGLLPRPVPEGPGRLRLRLPPGHPGQGVRRAARHPAGRVALQRRHLRHRPGLRAAAAAHAGPPAARGPRLRRPDAHELRKVIPSFLKRVDLDDRGVAWSTYLATTPHGDGGGRRAAVPADGAGSIAGDQSVRLVDFDPDAEVKLVAAMLYPYRTLPEDADRAHGCGPCPPTTALAVVRAYVGDRTNRRHKPGRALERVDYRFDVLADYGAFRDLQRHRMLTIEWQPLTPRHGYTRPDAVDLAGPDRGVRRGHGALRRRCTTRSSTRFPAQAPYAVSLAYKVRFVHAAQRPRGHAPASSCAPRRKGHPAYREVAPGDAPADRRAGRPPRRRRDDALRRPLARAVLERLGSRAPGRGPPPDPVIPSLWAMWLVGLKWLV